MEDSKSIKIRRKKRPFSRRSTTRYHLQSQVTKPTAANPNSESYDISNLPDADSIMIEIFTRLPLKSVFRFKCVSKHWLSLISHSSFKTLYISRMQALSLPFRILFPYIHDSGIEGVLDRILPESYDSSDSSLFLHMKQQKHSENFKVIGVSNGLFLCYSWEQHIYYVCDPVTRQRVRLPKNNIAAYYGEGFVTKIDEHNVVTSFTVVVVSLVTAEFWPSSHYLTVNTFSSETGEWLEYTLPCPSLITYARRSAVPIVFNGIFHWFVYEHDMVAFDPYKDPKSCRLIQFPDDLDVPSEDRHDMLYRLCDGCQGKLRVLQVAPDVSSFYCFSMWEMKDYEKGEWSSEFKVTRSDLSSSDPELNSLLMRARFVPLCFDPLNLDIVYMSCFELPWVVSYSIHNRRLDVACKLTGFANNLSWRVVVPFVIPRWPTRFLFHLFQDRELKESNGME